MKNEKLQKFNFNIDDQLLLHAVKSRKINVNNPFFFFFFFSPIQYKLEVLFNSIVTNEINLGDIPAVHSLYPLKIRNLKSTELLIDIECSKNCWIQSSNLNCNRPIIEWESIYNSINLINKLQIGSLSEVEIILNYTPEVKNSQQLIDTNSEIKFNFNNNKEVYNFKIKSRSCKTNISHDSSTDVNLGLCQVGEVVWREINLTNESELSLRIKVTTSKEISLLTYDTNVLVKELMILPYSFKELSIKYLPQVTGRRYFTIIFQNINDPSDTQIIRFVATVGRGSKNNLIIPSQFDLGNCYVGYNNESIIPVTNPTNEDLDISIDVPSCIKIFTEDQIIISNFFLRANSSNHLKIIYKPIEGGLNLIKKKYSINLTSSKSGEVLSVNSIICKAKVAKSIISLSSSELFFGDVNIKRTVKRSTIIQNISELHSEISIEFISTILSTHQSVISIPPKSSKIIYFTITPRFVNPDYSKQITIKNHMNPENTLLLTAYSNNMDTFGVTYHSKYYEIKDVIDLGRVYIGSTFLFDEKIKNTSDEEIILTFLKLPDINLYEFKEEKVLPLEFIKELKKIQSSPPIIFASNEEEVEFVKRFIEYKKKLSEMIEKGELFKINKLIIKPDSSKYIFIIVKPSSTLNISRWISKTYKLRVEFRDSPIRIIPIKLRLCTPKINIPQKSISFGIIEPHKSKSKSFTIENSSDTPFLYNIKNSGSIQSDSVEINEPLGYIRPYKSRDIHYTFRPRFKGEFRETLIIENILNPEVSETIEIKSLVIRPQTFKVDINNIDFGPVQRGVASARYPIKITNLGLYKRNIRISVIHSNNLPEGMNVSIEIRLNQTFPLISDEEKHQINYLKKELRIYERKKNNERIIQLKQDIEEILKKFIPKNFPDSIEKKDLFDLSIPSRYVYLIEVRIIYECFTPTGPMATSALGEIHIFDKSDLDFSEKISYTALLCHYKRIYLKKYRNFILKQQKGLVLGLRNLFLVSKSNSSPIKVKSTPTPPQLRKIPEKILKPFLKIEPLIIDLGVLDKPKIEKISLKILNISTKKQIKYSISHQNEPIGWILPNENKLIELEINCKIQKNNKILLFIEDEYHKTEILIKWIFNLKFYEKIFIPQNLPFKYIGDLLIYELDLGIIYMGVSEGFCKSSGYFIIKRGSDFPEIEMINNLDLIKIKTTIPNQLLIKSTIIDNEEIKIEYNFLHKNDERFLLKNKRIISGGILLIINERIIKRIHVKAIIILSKILIKNQSIYFNSDKTALLKLKNDTHLYPIEIEIDVPEWISLPINSFILNEELSIELKTFKKLPKGLIIGKIKIINKMTLEILKVKIFMFNNPKILKVEDEIINFGSIARTRDSLNLTKSELLRTIPVKITNIHSLPVCIRPRSDLNIVGVWGENSVENIRSSWEYISNFDIYSKFKIIGRPIVLQKKKTGILFLTIPSNKTKGHLILEDVTSKRWVVSMVPTKGEFITTFAEVLTPIINLGIIGYNSSNEWIDREFIVKISNSSESTLFLTPLKIPREIQLNDFESLIKIPPFSQFSIPFLLNVRLIEVEDYKSEIFLQNEKDPSNILRILIFGRNTLSRIINAPNVIKVTDFNIPLIEKIPDKSFSIKNLSLYDTIEINFIKKMKINFLKLKLISKKTNSPLQTTKFLLSPLEQIDIRLRIIPDDGKKLTKFTQDIGIIKLDYGRDIHLIKIKGKISLKKLIKGKVEGDKLKIINFSPFKLLLKANCKGINQIEDIRLMPRQTIIRNIKFLSPPYSLIIEHEETKYKWKIEIDEFIQRIGTPVLSTLELRGVNRTGKSGRYSYLIRSEEYGPDIFVKDSFEIFSVIETEYMIKLISESDEDWLIIKNSNGIIKAGDSVNIILNLLANKRRNRTTYLLIENLNNPLDIHIIKLTFEILISSTKSIIALIYDGKEREHSEIINVGNAVFDIFSDNETFVIRNKTRYPLEVQVNSEVQNIETEVQFSLSKAIPKLFKTLFLDAKSEKQLYVRRIFKFGGTSEDIAVEKFINILISCRLVKHQKQKFTLKYIVQKPELFVNINSLSFKEGDNHKIKIVNISHRPIKIQIFNDSLAFKSEIGIYQIDIGNFFELNIIAKNIFLKNIEEHISIYNLANLSESYIIRLRLSPKSTDYFLFAFGGSSSHPFNILEQRIHDLIIMYNSGQKDLNKLKVDFTYIIDELIFFGTQGWASFFSSRLALLIYTALPKEFTLLELKRLLSFFPLKKGHYKIVRKIIKKK